MVNYNAMAFELIELMKTNSKLKYRKDTSTFTQGEMCILALLDSDDSGITPGKLCECLNMTLPRISAALSVLEKKRLVSRITDSSDRRKLHVYITDRGRALVSEKLQSLAVDISSLLSTLGEEDSKEYIRILKRINSIAETR